MQYSRTPTSDQCKVLVAEDTPSNAILTMAVLSHADCSSVLVANGRQALIACQKEAFDLILMDVHMPEMDGVKATAAIRKWERQTGAKEHYIVGVTASAMPHELNLCLQAGMNKILTKPISIDELLEVVQQACCGR